MDNDIINDRLRVISEVPPVNHKLGITSISALVDFPFSPPIKVSIPYPSVNGVRIIRVYRDYADRHTPGPIIDIWKTIV